MPVHASRQHIWPSRTGPGPRPRACWLSKTCGDRLEQLQQKKGQPTKLALPLLELKKRQLATVAVQSLGDVVNHRLGEGRRSAELSLPLRRHAERQVAGARLTMLHLAVRRQAKSLLRSLVRLLLGHSRNSLINGIETSQTTDRKRFSQVAKGDFFV